MLHLVREKRSFIRIRLDIPACLFLFQLDIYQSGCIIDISSGGCFFPVDVDLPLGEKCYIDLTIGHGLEERVLNLQGKIIRKAINGIGIQFTDISTEDQIDLEQVIKHEGGTGNM